MFNFIKFCLWSIPFKKFINLRFKNIWIELHCSCCMFFFSAYNSLFAIIIKHYCINSDVLKILILFVYYQKHDAYINLVMKSKNHKLKGTVTLNIYSIHISTYTVPILFIYKLYRCKRNTVIGLSSIK